MASPLALGEVQGDLGFVASKGDDPHVGLQVGRGELQWFLHRQVQHEVVAPVKSVEEKVAREEEGKNTDTNIYIGLPHLHSSVCEENHSLRPLPGHKRCPLFEVCELVEHNLSFSARHLPQAALTSEVLGDVRPPLREAALRKQGSNPATNPPAAAPLITCRVGNKS